MSLREWIRPDRSGRPRVQRPDDRSADREVHGPGTHICDALVDVWSARRRAVRCRTLWRHLKRGQPPDQRARCPAGAGAGPHRVIRLVLREAGLLALLGVTAGVPSALLIGRGIRSLLFGVQQDDWRSIGAAVALLLTVAVVAAWLPARRAARVDPLVALRAE